MRNLSTLLIFSLLGLTACGGDGTSAVSLDQVSASPGSAATTISNQSSCVSSATPFGSGSGTAQDPFTICTAAQLRNIQANDVSFFAITADLDAGNVDQSGALIAALSGTLDGQNHTIINFRVNSLSANNAGFVGENTGTIKNLTLAGVIVNGTQNVGGVVGVNYGIIDNVTISGSVPSSNAGTNVGGIAGVNRGTISNSVTDLTIVGNNSVGGIVGDFQGGTIANVIVSGSVSGQFNIGGAVGYDDIRVTTGGTGSGSIGSVSVQATYPNGACMNGYLAPQHPSVLGNSC